MGRPIEVPWSIEYRHDTIVYLCHLFRPALLKIGMTGNLRCRFGNYTYWYNKHYDSERVGFIVLAGFYGSGFDESEAIKRFRKLRVQNVLGIGKRCLEWFAYSEEIVRYYMVHPNRCDLSIAGFNQKTGLPNFYSKVPYADRIRKAASQENRQICLPTD